MFLDDGADEITKREKELHRFVVHQDTKKGSAASTRLSNDINYLQLISFGDIFKIVQFKIYKARILHIRARVRVAHALVYAIKSSLNFRKTKSFLNQI